MSRQCDFSFGTVLNTLLTNTNCKSSYFANHYVYKDASLVSKWLHGTQFPTPDVFPLIVRFAMEQSSAATRSLMRVELDRIVSSAALDEATKQTLAGIRDFDGYLLGVLNVLASMKKGAAAVRASTPPPAVNGAPAPDAPLRTATYKPALASSDIVFTAAAAFCGETLWQLAAALLGLKPVPGALGGVAGGWSAAWGVMLALPAIGFALLSLGGKTDFMRALTPARKLAFLGGYSAAGGAAGLLLGYFGLSRASQLSLAPPAALVGVCSLVLSFLPLLCVYALLRRPRFHAGTFLLLEFGPCLACSFVALPFMLHATSRQAGDIFAGFMLGLMMYCSVRAVLQSYPNKIRFRMFDRDAG